MEATNRNHQFIQIRPTCVNDHAFIYSTYLKSNWYSKDQTTTLKKITWIGLQRRRIEKILNDKLAVVACLKEEPDLILGYGLMDGEKPFAYVKLAWRGENFDLKNLLINHVEKMK